MLRKAFFDYEMLRDVTRALKVNNEYEPTREARRKYIKRHNLERSLPYYTLLAMSGVGGSGAAATWISGSLKEYDFMNWIATFTVSSILLLLPIAGYSIYRMGRSWSHMEQLVKTAKAVKESEENKGEMPGWARRDRKIGFDHL